MKIVTYDKRTNIVIGLFPEIKHPEIDRENGIIFHENGTFHRTNNDDYGFLLLEDTVPVQIGDMLTEYLRTQDQSNKYEGFDLRDIGDAIKKMGQEVVQEIKDLFSKKEDKNE